jgi:peptidoglycan hydrolase-like protein with peptidoglycan-binding domain
MRAPRFVLNSRLQKAEQNAPALKQGETGDGVRVLQQALIDLGFAMPLSKPAAHGNPDGVFGTETQAAVIAFQRREGLLADAIVGRQTLGRLDEIFAANDGFFGRTIQENPRSFAYLRSSSRRG